MRILKLAACVMTISAAMQIHAQPRSIESLSIEEIREELNQLLDTEFDRATDIDRTSAVLVRIKNFYERRPEIVQAQLGLPLSEIEIIHQTITTWINSPNRDGDNRINRMCEVWHSTPFTGTDRIDTALLAYEREISTGYAEFTETRVEELLDELEAVLPANTWVALTDYLNTQVSNFSGNISHSFFTNVVRRTQSVDSMELHCGP